MVGYCIQGFVVSANYEKPNSTKAEAWMGEMDIRCLSLI